MRLLIVEDDPSLAETVAEELRSNFVVDISNTGKQGIFMAQTTDYDLIILDLGLPDMTGTEVCTTLRKTGTLTPILILTAENDLDGKVAALDAGADDYLLKPFKFPELSARLRALLRRNPENFTPDILVVGDLSMNTVNHQVIRDGQEIPLRRREYNLLEYLMRNEGRVLTRDMILEHVWERGSEVLTNVLDVHIKYLRDKVDRPFGKRLIKTVHGLGYKIES